jgi:hypothetical protein
MQLVAFLLSVTDGYLLGVYVVRKYYANLRGRGGGGLLGGGATKFVDTSKCPRPSRPMHKNFPVCTFHAMSRLA